MIPMRQLNILAATLGEKKGLRVIDTERMREVAADRDYDNQSYGAAFASDVGVDEAHVRGGRRRQSAVASR